MAVLVACVSVCVIVTVTPGSTALLVSVTRPLNSAVDSCADADAAVRSKVSAPRDRFRRKRPIRPPMCLDLLRVETARSLALFCAAMTFDRREFLTGIGALAAAAMARFAQAQGTTRLFRIDTHAHFTIPKMYDLATAHGVQQATLKDWSPAKMLAEMEGGGGGPPITSI